MEILKGVGVAKITTWTPKHFNNIPKEWRSSRQVKTNKATPKKFYLEYSKDPKTSRFVFHPKTGPNIYLGIPFWGNTVGKQRHSFLCDRFDPKLFWWRLRLLVERGIRDHALDLPGFKKKSPLMKV